MLFLNYLLKCQGKPQRIKVALKKCGQYVFFPFCRLLWKKSASLLAIISLHMIHALTQQCSNFEDIFNMELKQPRTHNGSENVT